MLLQACIWLNSTWLSTTIRHSKWGFATIEMGHLVALALLGGALFIMILRVFGLLLAQQSLAATLVDLRRLIVTGLLGMFVTGVLLFTEGPLRYYANVAFRAKLLAIGAGLFFLWKTLRHAGRLQNAVTPTTVKIAAASSVFLLLFAAIAGRVIGVL